MSFTTSVFAKTNVTQSGDIFTTINTNNGGNPGGSEFDGGGFGVEGDTVTINGTPINLTVDEGFLWDGNGPQGSGGGTLSTAVTIDGVTYAAGSDVETDYAAFFNIQGTDQYVMVNHLSINNTYVGVVPHKIYDDATDTVLDELPEVGAVLVLVEPDGPNGPANFGSATFDTYTAEDTRQNAGNAANWNVGAADAYDNDIDLAPVNIPTPPTDTDGDGIPDVDDIDDDNDGILDTDEGLNPSTFVDSGVDGALGLNNDGNDNTNLAISFGISSADLNDRDEEHVLDSITIQDGGNAPVTYTDFVLPDVYQSTAPDGSMPMPENVNVRLTVGQTTGINITDNNYESEILSEAFQSRNLNAYQTMDSNNFQNSAYTLSYNTPVTITAGGFIALTERGGNNSTTVTALDANGNVLGSVTADKNEDYLPTGAKTSSGQDVRIALFPIDDLGDVGEQISQLVVTLPDTGSDGPDGKIFIFGDQSLLQPRDTDGDGTPDYLDPDSDNDGISDLRESGVDVSVLDPDDNGVIDGAPFADTNGNGLADAIEAANGNGVGTDPVDSDNDGLDDYIDLDSDDDGISDFIENQPTATYTPFDDTDTDGDGVIDLVDQTPGHGGDFAAPANTDGQDSPDYLDDDSDNDGLDDVDESGLGQPGADANGDGIGDAIPNVSFDDQDGDVTGLPNGGLTNTDTDPTEPDFRSINDPNQPPVALDDEAILVPGTPIQIDIFADNGSGADSDPDNDPLEIVSIEDPANPGVQIPFQAGQTVTLGSGTTVTFGATPSDPLTVDQPFYSDGTDTFNYTIADPDGEEASATVVINTDTDGDGIANVDDIDDDNDGIIDIVEAGSNPTEELVIPTGTLGQADAFNNSALTFQVINNTALGEGQLFALNPRTADYEPIGDNAGFSYNAMGYDPDSNFLYALVSSDTPGTDALGNPVARGDLIKVDVDGEVFRIGATGVNAVSGDVVDGFLISQTGGKIFKIDLTDGTSTELTELSPVSNSIDYANIDGTLYGIRNGNTLQQVDVDVVADTASESTATITSATGDPLNLTGSGAMWAATNDDGDPELYAFNNNTGEVFRIDGFDTNAPVATLIGMTVVSNNNDGGRNVETAFVPPIPDTDGDGAADHLDIDKDNDGITDNVEAQTTAGYIAPSGIDSDQDGLDDAYDADLNGAANSAGLTPVDTDNDGDVDMVDTDSDNDGTDDVAERGDGQPTSIPAVLADEDGDGLLDAFEGADADDGFDVNDENIGGDNGGLDGDYSDFNLGDADGDTNADAAVPGRTGNDAVPLDNDLDFRDNNEPPVATDDTKAVQPGTPTQVDVIGGNLGNGPDSDPDGDPLEIVSIEDPANPGVQIPFQPNTTVTLGSGTTVTFGPTASDPLTVEQPLFTDSVETFGYTITDGHGHTDDAVVTIQSDTDGDGIANVTDIDDDNDGILDIVETGGVDPNGPGTPNTDGDAAPDHLDIDADNDGITDNVEAQTTAGYIAPSGIDSDQDGLDDAYDADLNGAANSAGLTPVDTDQDGDADVIDLNSDNDLTPDVAERGDGQATAVPANPVDSDGDGLLDVFEGADASDGFDVNDENILGDDGGLDGDYTAFNMGDTDTDTNADAAVPGRTGNDAVPMVSDLNWRDDAMMTEDVWFHGVPCDPNDLQGVDTEWTVYGGSDKLKLEVKIPIEAIFGDNTLYTFDSVDITPYEDLFTALGATELSKVKVRVKDDEVFIRIVAKNVPLSDAEIDALPDVVDTPVTVMDAYGNIRSVDLCVGIDETKVNSPVAFDLNGDGQIGVTGPSTAKVRVDDTPGDGVLFDIDADGHLDRIEWLSGDGDALLVDNRDGFASRDMDGSRLFGDDAGTYNNGYEKLALLDANNDGKLTGAELDGLALWADDGDAMVEAGELHSVAAHGIESINVTHGNVLNGAGETLIRSEADFGAAGQLTPTTDGIDLVVARVTLDDAIVEQDDDLEIFLDVANLGNQDAADVKTTVYWSATDSFDINTAVKLKNDKHGTLEAGELDGNERVKVKYEAIAPLGDGYIFAVIDAVEDHAELDETNNISQGVAVSVVGGSQRADLSVSNARIVDATLDEGQTLKVKFDAVNSGPVTARSVETTLYWSADDQFDAQADVALGTDGHGKLRAFEVDGNERIKVAYDDVAALGDGYLFLQIDPENEHIEDDEGNNVSDAMALDIVDAGPAQTGADVTVTDIAVDRAVLADGDKAKVFVDVANIGTEEAEDVETFVFWSADTQFDANVDVELGVIRNRDLDPGEVELGEDLRIKYEDLEQLGDGYLFALAVAPNGDVDPANNLSAALEIELI